MWMLALQLVHSCFHKRSSEIRFPWMFLSIFVGFSRHISKFTLNCACAQMKAMFYAKRNWNLASGQVYEYNCVAKRTDEGLMESRLSYAQKALQNGRLFIDISVLCQALNGSKARLPSLLKRVSGNCCDNGSRRTIDMRGVSRAWSFNSGNLRARTKTRPESWFDKCDDFSRRDYWTSLLTTV